jgi:hypothetical protein
MDHENRVLISVSGRKLVGFGLIFVISIFTVVTYLIALYAFIAPSVDFPLDVVNVGTYDAGGNASISFSRGAEETVIINVTVEMATHYYFNLPSSDNYSFNADVSYRVIIAIRDKNNQPVEDCKYFSKTISVGEKQETSFSYKVNHPIKGQYTIEVMAWADTGEPLTPSREDVTFIVS